MYSNDKCEQIIWSKSKTEKNPQHDQSAHTIFFQVNFFFVWTWTDSMYRFLLLLMSLWRYGINERKFTKCELCARRVCSTESAKAQIKSNRSSQFVNDQNIAKQHNHLTFPLAIYCTSFQFCWNNFFFRLCLLARVSIHIHYKHYSFFLLFGIKKKKDL